MGQVIHARAVMRMCRPVPPQPPAEDHPVQAAGRCEMCALWNWPRLLWFGQWVHTVPGGATFVCTAG
jgi:hypothetical protein